MEKNNKNLYERYFEVTYRYLPKRDAVWKSVAKYLQRFVPKDSAVLDLGAGYCGFINNIEAKEKFAIDQGETVKKYAAPDVRTSMRDASDLGEFADGAIDVVFASNLLEHLDDENILRLLREAMRVLKRGGKLIVMQPNFAYAYKHYFDDFTHKRIFTHVSLRDVLLASGFAVKRVSPKFMPYSMRQSFPGQPWLVALYLRSPWKPFAGQMLLIAEKE